MFVKSSQINMFDWKATKISTLPGKFGYTYSMLQFNSWQNLINFTMFSGKVSSKVSRRTPKKMTDDPVKSVLRSQILSRPWRVLQKYESNSYILPPVPETVEIQWVERKILWDSLLARDWKFWCVYLFSFLQFDLKFGFQFFLRFGFQFMFFVSLVSNWFFLQFDLQTSTAKKLKKMIKKYINTLIQNQNIYIKKR
jgi:hypothetical protein